MTQPHMRSPILLIAAAQALIARPTLVLHRPHGSPLRPADAAIDGMRFVQHAGYWSHFNPRIGASTWPFDQSSSLVELTLRACQWDVVRERGEAGDLVVRSGDDGLPARIGIVLHVEHRIHIPGVFAIKCDIAWGLPRPGDRPAAELKREWVRPEQGDRFVAWYDAPEPRAALRRVA